MPYADNQGCKIHYQVEGTGPPVLLAHGFSSSGEDWRELGYVEPLKADFQLVMVDGRGHGQSDKPHDPRAYSPEDRAKDTLAVLDDLGIPRAHYWGFSAGGVVGFCLAKYAPERFLSVVIGGLDPYESLEGIEDRVVPYKKPLQGLPHSENPVLGALQAGPQAWLEFWQANMTVPPGMRARLLENDFAALQAQWTNPYKWRAEVAPFLDRFPLPALLYVGEAEDNYPGMKACAARMPEAQFFPVPASHHFDIWAKVEEIMTAARAFMLNPGGVNE